MKIIAKYYSIDNELIDTIEIKTRKNTNIAIIEEAWLNAALKGLDYWYYQIKKIYSYTNPKHTIEYMDFDFDDTTINNKTHWLPLYKVTIDPITNHATNDFTKSNYNPQ